MEKTKLYFWIIRLLALVLCFVTSYEAFAGVHFYQGFHAFHAKQYEKSAQFLEQAYRMNPLNSRVGYYLARSLRHQGLQEKEKGQEKLEKALPILDRLVETMPFYGRFQLHRGLTRLALKTRFEKPIEWAQIQSDLAYAVGQVPGSPHVASMAAGGYFSLYQALSEPQKQQALDWMRKSIRLHFPNPNYPYINKPSPFLERSANWVWGRFKNVELLKSLFSQDRDSYQFFVEFLREKEIKKSYSDIYQRYLELQSEEYERLCTKAEILIKEGNYEDAFMFFRKAFWMRSWSYLRAKAGIITTQFLQPSLMGWNHELFSEKPFKTLQSVLEDEDDDLGATLKWMQPAVSKTGDPYLIGLYYYRVGEYKKAIEYFDRVNREEVSVRRYLADSYWQTGQRREGIDLLKGVLSEKNPDLRDLFLLHKWGVIEKSALDAKAKLVTQQNKNSRAWWGNDFSSSKMSKPGKLNMTINLVPGISRADVFVRSLSSNKEVGYIVILLNGKPLGSYAVESSKWQPIPVQFQSSGGKRTLQVEYLKGKANPGIELGPVSLMNQGNNA